MRPLPRRATPSRTLCMAWACLPLRQMMPRPAPVQSIMASRPRTRVSTCVSIRYGSLISSGSHEAPLTSTVCAAASALTCVGRPAPPAPTTPAARMASTIGFPMMSSHWNYRKAGRQSISLLKCSLMTGKACLLAFRARIFRKALAEQLPHFLCKLP